MTTNEFDNLKRVKNGRKFWICGWNFFYYFFALNIMLLHKFENDLNIISELMDFE